MATLKINGTDVKEPASLQFGLQDIDSSNAGRNLDGDMLRDRIAKKRKISCVWNGLTDSEISTLLTAMEDESFSLTYPDALLGTSRTMTVYVGDRTAPVYRYDDVKNSYFWQNLSANFIEM